MDNFLISHQKGWAMAVMVIMLLITFPIMSFTTNFFEKNFRKGMIVGILIVLIIILSQAYVSPLAAIYGLLSAFLSCTIFLIVVCFDKHPNQNTSV